MSVLVGGGVLPHIHKVRRELPARKALLNIFVNCVTEPAQANGTKEERRRRSGSRGLDPPGIRTAILFVVFLWLYIAVLYCITSRYSILFSSFFLLFEDRLS